MISEQLTNFMTEYRVSIDEALQKHLPVSYQQGAERLNDAIAYAVFPGGKRVRPLLSLLGAMNVSGSWQQMKEVACAMEFLHTSSLILDDLPAMDNAKLRRGQKSLHLAYGESVALLAALALLNKSYELIANGAGASGAQRLIGEAAVCIGVTGMIGGQAADLGLACMSDGRHRIESQSLKTTALMRLTMISGAMVCNASEEQVAALARYGENLGIAYQIRDDLLDAEEDYGSRSSLICQLGEEDAHRMAMQLIEEGKQQIAAMFPTSEATALLGDFADGILNKVEYLVLSTRA